VTASFELTGRKAEAAVLEAGVVTNRNSIPSDPNGAWYTSGIRLGTPLTTFGLGPAEMDEISEIITIALQATSPRATKSGLSQARYVIDQKISTSAASVAQTFSAVIRCTHRSSSKSPVDQSLEATERAARQRRAAIADFPLGARPATRRSSHQAVQSGCPRNNRSIRFRINSDSRRRGWDTWMMVADSAALRSAQEPCAELPRPTERDPKAAPLRHGNPEATH
jgi:hypothetical protein